MPRVVIFSPKAPTAIRPPNGAQRYILELGVMLKSLGLHVFILGLEESGLPHRERVRGVSVIRRQPNLRILSGMRSILKSDKTVFCIDNIMAFPPVLGALFSGKKRFVSIKHHVKGMHEIIHLRSLKSIGTFLIEKVLEAPIYTQKPTVVPSTFTNSKLSKKRQKRTTVIHPICPVPKIPLPNPKKIQNDKLTLIYIGAVDSGRKRVGHLLNGLRTAYEAGAKIELSVVGGGADFLKLQHEFASDYVTFHGRVSEEEKFRLLRQSDFLVTCSVNEGFGIIFVEAGHVGVPIIAPHKSPETIVPNINAVIHDNTEKNLVETLFHAAEMDRSSWSRLSAGSEHISQKYSAENAKDLWKKILFAP